LKIAGREMVVGDLSRVRSKTPFVAMMPQWQFLDFLRTEGARSRSFCFNMGVGVDDVSIRSGRVEGVRLSSGEVLPASLVIAADGRRSVVRRNGILPVKDLGSSIDVFWFELPKRTRERGTLRIAVEHGSILVRVDRGTYWQCAFVVRKGTATQILSQGIEAVQAKIEAVDRRLGSIAEDLADLSQLHLLDVALDRLTRWYRPGLLAIGDAAHAMSPMGGIGINVAIQDAVAAANVLAGPLARGEPVDHILKRVQRRRYATTMLIQAVQKIAQDWVLAPVLANDEQQQPPWPLLALQAAPMLRRAVGQAIAMGVRRESVALAG
jgi:2-polyprenyl-6-methoxyphenol hydroxylase-like FAD-dependent oxidoreductase